MSGVVGIGRASIVRVVGVDVHAERLSTVADRDMHTGGYGAVSRAEMVAAESIVDIGNSAVALIAGAMSAFNAYKVEGALGVVLHHGGDDRVQSEGTRVSAD